ncbi:hypothetical protein BS47DRAFT_1394818 [Hydnum rufescens UP504]|uniref:Uncharacterized protein n=1 Tax=Hydnum rufescens UP504 TaxID=1448309 RepID=A0A9P6AU26_9AGAM|nr:hypothetical protein BS47DRAFT_1394818 [Hydnum rufescens UP504]
MAEPPPLSSSTFNPISSPQQHLRSRGRTPFIDFVQQSNVLGPARFALATSNIPRALEKASPLPPAKPSPTRPLSPSHEPNNVPYTPAYALVPVSFPTTSPLMPSTTIYTPTSPLASECLSSRLSRVRPISLGHPSHPEDQGSLSHPIRLPPQEESSSEVPLQRGPSELPPRVPRTHYRTSSISRSGSQIGTPHDADGSASGPSSCVPVSYSFLPVTSTVPTLELSEARTQRDTDTASKPHNLGSNSTRTTPADNNEGHPSDTDPLSKMNRTMKQNKRNTNSERFSFIDVTHCASSPVISFSVTVKVVPTLLDDLPEIFKLVVSDTFDMEDSDHPVIIPSDKVDYGISAVTSDDITTEDTLFDAEVTVGPSPTVEGTIAGSSSIPFVPAAFEEAPHDVKASTASESRALALVEATLPSEPGGQGSIDVSPDRLNQRLICTKLNRLNSVLPRRMMQNSTAPLLPKPRLQLLKGPRDMDATDALLADLAEVPLPSASVKQPRAVTPGPCGPEDDLTPAVSNRPGRHARPPAPEDSLARATSGRLVLDTPTYWNTDATDVAEVPVTILLPRHKGANTSQDEDSPAPGIEHFRVFASKALEFLTLYDPPRPSISRTANPVSGQTGERRSVQPNQATSIWQGVVHVCADTFLDLLFDGVISS